MLFLTENKSFITTKTAIRLADILLVYTILAPIFLNVIGSYFKLNENFIRTFIVLLGPAFVSIIIYIKVFGLHLTKKNFYTILIVSCLTLIILLSSMRNWGSILAVENLKFFMAYCVSGFLLGMIAKFKKQRARIFLKIWIYYILTIIMFCLYLYLNNDYLSYRFTFPGDNPARTGALFFFFTFCGLTNFMLSGTVASKIFWGFICAICVLIGVNSNTRSAILVFGMAFFVYVLFQIYQCKSKFERSSLISLICVSVVFCCLIWFFVIDSKIKNKIINMFNLPGQTLAYIFEKDQEAYRKILRLPIWRNAISKFMGNPIFGSGFGSEYYGEVVKKKYNHPHNIILQFLAETGVIGLGTFILFILFVFKKAIIDYRSQISKNDKLAYLFYPVSFFFFLLFSCFHFAIHENYFFWYFAGIIVGFETDENGKSLPRKRMELQCNSA